MKTAEKTYTAAEIDAAFDNGEEILHMFDLASARVVTSEAKRVNVDFPVWMVKALDREAGRLGVTRQSLIKMWIAGKLEAVKG